MLNCAQDFYTITNVRTYFPLNPAASHSVAGYNNRGLHPSAQYWRRVFIIGADTQPTLLIRAQRRVYSRRRTRQAAQHFILRERRVQPAPPVHTSAHVPPRFPRAFPSHLHHHFSCTNTLSGRRENVRLSSAPFQLSQRGRRKELRVSRDVRQSIRYSSDSPDLCPGISGGGCARMMLGCSGLRCINQLVIRSYIIPHCRGREPCLPGRLSMYHRCFKSQLVSVPPL